MPEANPETKTGAETPRAWYAALEYSVFTNSHSERFLQVEHKPSGRGLSFRLRWLRGKEPTAAEVVEFCDGFAEQLRGWLFWAQDGCGYGETLRRVRAERLGISERTACDG